MILKPKLKDRCYETYDPSLASVRFEARYSWMGLRAWVAVRASANVGKGLPDTTRRIYNDGGRCLFCRRLLESLMSPSSDCWPEHVLQSGLAADYFCHVFKAP